MANFSERTCFCTSIFGSRLSSNVRLRSSSGVGSGCLYGHSSLGPRGGFLQGGFGIGTAPLESAWSMSASVRCAASSGLAAIPIVLSSSHCCASVLMDRATFVSNAGAEQFFKFEMSVSSRLTNTSCCALFTDQEGRNVWATVGFINHRDYMR